MELVSISLRVDSGEACRVLMLGARTLCLHGTESAIVSFLESLKQEISSQLAADEKDDPEAEARDLNAAVPVRE